MYIGDIVMFTCTGQYSEYFFGQLGEVISESSDYSHFTVKWINPVKYHNSYTSKSSFPSSKFTVLGKNESR